MHELTITKNLIDIATSECKKEDISSPKKIVAELGSLTGYSKDSILFYYDLLKKDSNLLFSTELEIKEIDARILCRHCMKESGIKEPYMIFCQVCGSRDVEIISGKDLRIKEIKAGE